MTLDEFVDAVAALPVRWRLGGHWNTAIEGVDAGYDHRPEEPLVLLARFRHPHFFREDFRNAVQQLRRATWEEDGIYQRLTNVARLTEELDRSCREPMFFQAGRLLGMDEADVHRVFRACACVPDRNREPEEFSLRERLLVATRI